MEPTGVMKRCWKVKYIWLLFMILFMNSEIWPPETRAAVGKKKKNATNAGSKQIDANAKRNKCQIQIDTKICYLVNIFKWKMLPYIIFS